MTLMDQAIVDAPVAEDGIGTRLRAAREARGLSVADISQTLKFSHRQIELVEGNAWSELPGQTFVRGCVSNYARFLQLDPQPLLKELETANMPKPAVLVLPGSTNAKLPLPGRSGGRDLAAVIGGLVLVLTAMAVYYLVPDDFWKGVGRQDGGSQKAAASKSPAPTAPEAVPPAPAVPATASGASAPAGAEAQTAPFPRVDPATPGATVLRFEFDQASWVEVRDSNGLLVHSQNNAAGTVQEVSGVIPLAVVIGDARRVRMFYKSNQVDLAPHTNPHSNVARLNIE